MGLLLSVLVACVGIIELISLCTNVRRSLILPPISGNLSCVREKYIQELSGIENDPQRSDLISAVKENNVNTQRQVPTFRLNSHEDIEVEYNKNIVTRSRTPSPRRYLVTEKNVKSKSSSSAPRHFVVSEEPQGIRKSECKTSIPEFLIQEQLNSNKSWSHPRYVLKDNGGRSGSPIPLPSQFVLTGEDSNALRHTDAFSDISISVSDSNFEEYSRRSSSPYPLLDLPQSPRSSIICNKVVNDHAVSVLEEDEDLYISASPNNIRHATTNLKISPFNEISVGENNLSHIEKNVLATTVIERAKSKLELKNNGESVYAEVAAHLNHKEHIESTFSKQTNETYFGTSVYNDDSLNSSDGTNKQTFVTKNYRSKIVKQLSVNGKEQCLPKLIDSSKNENVTKAFNHPDEKVEPKSDSESSATCSKEFSPIASCSKDSETKKEAEPFWLIFSGEYTKAMNKDWHGQHFCCWQCDESLTGQRYVLRDDHPYCVSCYESVFANACEKCSRTIGIDSKDLSYKDKHWHEACFLCTTCGESLVDKQFGSKGDRIYCGSCYDQQFASRCDGCHEIFRAGTKKMEYKTRQWHEKCFCCCVCKVPIGTQSFIPREQEIYCAKCYEEKFATRCIKCNKVITSGGVTYKNEPWHRECFTCTHCQKSLAGERFTSRDEKPFCAECFGELFAKRCTACNKPITGIGGTKFISFEDRHWHNDCFFCASCRTSLVGRGFITDNEDIICPECAKQKLM